MAKKSTKRKRLQIKYLIADPSFFVRKNGLRKISRLEEKIARFELSKLSASNSPNTSGLEVETTGRTQTISSGGAGGARSRAEFSSKELSMCKPTIVLPDALRVLDELQSGKQTVEDVIENPELKQVFKQWGLGKGFEKRIKELHSGKLLVEFFNERKIKYATADEFNYNPQKIGKDSIHRVGLREMFSSAPAVADVIFQMLAVSVKERPRAIIATCNGRFLKMITKIQAAKFRSGLVLETGAISVKTYFFNIGETFKDYAAQISDYIPPELVANADFSDVLTFVPVISIARGSYLGVQHFRRKRRTREEKERGRLEDERIKREINAQCKEKGFLVQAKFPPQMSPYR